MTDGTKKPEGGDMSYVSTLPRKMRFTVGVVSVVSVLAVSYWLTAGPGTRANRLVLHRSEERPVLDESKHVTVPDIVTNPTVNNRQESERKRDRPITYLTLEKAIAERKWLESPRGREWSTASPLPVPGRDERDRRLKPYRTKANCDPLWVAYENAYQRTKPDGGTLVAAWLFCPEAAMIQKP